MYLKGEATIDPPHGFPTIVTVGAEKWEEVTQEMVREAIVLRLKLHKRQYGSFDIAYVEMQV